MSWVRKNGGVISVYYSVLLGVAGLVMSTSLYQIKMKRDLIVLSELRRERHLIYLEMIYYIRNEIYDGYFSDLEYENNGWLVRVDFDKKENIAWLVVSKDEWTFPHSFLYDTECRCILEVFESDDLGVKAEKNGPNE